MDKQKPLDRMDPTDGLARLSVSSPGETPEQARKRLFWKLIFEHLAEWAAGDPLALARAIAACRICHEPPPRQLERALINLIIGRLTAAEQHTQHELEVHRLRWRAVIELRGQRVSWPKCWPAAAKQVRGTEAEGSAETVRQSYILVQKLGGARATLEHYKVALRGRQYRRKLHAAR